MGIALIIPDMDFSGDNIGKVTFAEDIAVMGLVINAQEAYTARKVTLAVSYIPASTSQRGVKWSILSGLAYASIDELTGVLTVNENAAGGMVTVKAESIFDASKIATATFAVTWQASVDELYGITEIIAEKTDLNEWHLSAVMEPEETSYRGVTWSIVSGGSYASVDAETGVLKVLETATAEHTVTVKCTSTYNPAYTATRTLTVAYMEVPSWNLAKIKGAIDLITTGLITELINNRHTALIEFTDDTVWTFNSSGCTVFSTGYTSTTNNIGLYPGAMFGMYAYNHGAVIVFNTALYEATHDMATGAASIPRGLTARIYHSGDADADILPKTLILKTATITADGVELETATKTGNANIKYLCFGFCPVTASTAIGLTDVADIYKTRAININNNVTLKLKTFIIVPGNIATAEEVKAARESAYVDILFDNEGRPYNRNTAYPLMTAPVDDL